MPPSRSRNGGRAARHKSASSLKGPAENGVPKGQKTAKIIDNPEAVQAASNSPRLPSPSPPARRVGVQARGGGHFPVPPLRVTSVPRVDGRVARRISASSLKYPTETEIPTRPKTAKIIANREAVQVASNSPRLPSPPPPARRVGDQARASSSRPSPTRDFGPVSERAHRTSQLRIQYRVPLRDWGSWPPPLNSDDSRARGGTRGAS